MSYRLLATNCPLPQGLSTLPTVSGCSSSSTTAPVPPFTGWNQGVSNNVPLQLNQLLAQIAGGMGFGGNGFGVLDGLTLSTAASLSLPVAAGHGSMMSVVEYGGGSVVVPDNTAFGFIWLYQNGTATYTTSTSAPAGPPSIYIGNFTTSGGAVTVVDYSGVVYVQDGILWRWTGDVGAPTDSPSGRRLFTTTLGGTWQWNGSAHVNPVAAAYNQQTLTTTLVLNATSPSVQHLTGASDQSVYLPADGTANFGQSFAFFNDNPSGGHNILIYDSTGTILITTLTPLHQVTIPVLNRSGSPAWPHTAISGTAQPSVGASLVQTSVQAGGGGATQAATTPNPPAIGNLVAVLVICGNTQTPSSVTNSGGGFTLSSVASGSGTAHNWAVFAGIAAGTVTNTYTATISGATSMELGIVEANGVTTYDVSAYNESVTGTTLTGPTTGATANADEIAIAMFGATVATGGTTYSAPTNGWTIDSQVANICLLTKILVATGAQSTGVTASMSVTASACITIAFK